MQKRSRRGLRILGCLRRRDQRRDVHLYPCKRNAAFRGALRPFPQDDVKGAGEIGAVGGPRCCKRDSFLSVLAAVDFVKEHFGLEMEKPDVVCTYASQNNQCIGKRCPFSPANH